MQTPLNCKALLSVFLTDKGALRFVFEPEAEAMIESNNLHGLIGDVIAEFGENFRHKNRIHMKPIDADVSRIIIPKGARF